MYLNTKNIINALKAAVIMDLSEYVRLFIFSVLVTENLKNVTKRGTTKKYLKIFFSGLEKGGLNQKCYYDDS